MPQNKEIGGFKIPLMKEKTKINNAKDIIKGLKPEYRQEKRECFGIIMLSTKNKVIADQIISIGTLNASLVHPREVFRPAIINASASIILIHNHPSGDPEPSPQDKEMAEKLTQASKIMGIEILDFIIYGNDGYTSFNEKGLL